MNKRTWPLVFSFSPIALAFLFFLNIFNLIPLNGEEFFTYEKFENIVTLDREEFLTYEKFENVVPLDGEEFWNYENIFNLVLLNGEECLRYEKFAKFIPLKGEEFQNHFKYATSPAWQRRNLKIWKICQSCRPYKQKKFANLILLTEE